MECYGSHVKDVFFVIISVKLTYSKLIFKYIFISMNNRFY